MDQDMWMPIFELLPKHFKVEFLDDLINTFAMSLSSHYVRTKPSGEIDDLYLPYYSSRGCGHLLAKYAVEFETPVSSHDKKLSHIDQTTRNVAPCL